MNINKDIYTKNEKAIHKKIGMELALARKRAGFSRAALAEKLSLTQQTIGLYERAQLNLSVARLATICHALNVDSLVIIKLSLAQTDYKNHC